jgi:hypothetical protein
LEPPDPAATPGVFEEHAAMDKVNVVAKSAVRMREAAIA